MPGTGVARTRAAVAEGSRDARHRCRGYANRDAPGGRVRILLDMTRKLTWLVAAVIVVLVVLMVRQYFAPGKVMVRQLEAAAEALEGRSLLGTLAPISRRYSDPYGQSYETLAGYVKLLFDSYEELSFDLDVTEVAVDGERATTKVRFLLRGRAGGQSGTILGTFTDRCRATLQWREEPQGWRVVSADDLYLPQAQAEVDAMRRDHP